jgi:hypothetical protein
MSDVFSAGLIFGFYLLKGRHPYGSQFNIPANIVNDTPVNLKGMCVPFLKPNFNIRYNHNKSLQP